jgi:nucleoside-diphosphate-sugar epimerase
MDVLVIGSGLLARSFLRHVDTLTDTCIYAAGVSNSSCTDPEEFVRDWKRLQETLLQLPKSMMVVYFSTCSVEDSSLYDTAYVQYKLRAEELVRSHAKHLVVRLPQVAGHTPNPHTLLNYLYARISRSEKFDLWQGAARNIIDVEDMASIVTDLLVTEGTIAETINVANTANSTILEIVRTFETVTSHIAVFNLCNRGSSYMIDCSRISAAVTRQSITFGKSYLHQVIKKYYG